MDKRRILVLDDHAKTRKTLSDILRTKGYTPISAATGQEALDRVKKGAPAVALIDLRLEDMSGLDVMREIKESSPGTECIVLTGHASKASAIEAVDLGAYSYLQKPLDMEHLLLTVQRAFDKREAAEALRDSEERFRNIYEQSPIGIELYDSDGQLLHVNRACLEIFGISDVEEVKAFKLFEDPNVTDEVKERLHKGESVRYETLFDFEKVKQLKLYDTSKSGIIYLDVVMTPLGLNTKGHVDCYLLQVQDITERKRLEAQLIQSAKMASLGVMAGGIAHEIRNPLGICLLGAEFLLKNPHDRVIREQCADKIYFHVNRASRIIENLIKFARPSADDRGPIDLNETLKATLSLTKNQIALQGIELNRQFAKDVPRVIGSSNLLQQVFLNIILNAANAMPEGGNLTISTRVNPEGKAEVRFADTGCGIPREHLDNMFDPFFTTMPAGKGTGLGLSVSYGIIQQHGGSIEVESVVGAGTTFTVKLLLTRDDRAGLET